MAVIWRATVVLISETATYVVEARKRESGLELMIDPEVHLFAKTVHQIILWRRRARSADYGDVRSMRDC